MKLTMFVAGTVAYWLAVASIMFLFTSGPAVTDSTEKSLQQFTDPQAMAQMDIIRKNHDLSMLVKSGIFIIACSLYVEQTIKYFNTANKKGDRK